VFVAHNGQRKAKRVGDQKAAKHVASQIRRRLAAGDFQLRRDGPSFEVLAREWLARYPVVRSIRAATIENYKSFTERHLLPFFGKLPVSAITTGDVEAFIAAKRGASGSSRFPGRPLSPSSLRVGLVALRLILDRAVAAKHLAVNPAARLARFRRVEEDAVDPFTPAELRAIVEAAESMSRDLATWIRLWAQSGMRAGEVTALQVQDVDMERGVAVVRHTYSRERLGPTKTGRVREVSFLHPVLEDTAAWRPGATAGSRAVLTGLRRLSVRSLEPGAFLFGGGAAPISSAARIADWRRVLARAGVRYRPPQQLRHTLASILLSRNAPLLYVQRQGGWRSAAVLLRVYARWMPQDGLGEVAPMQPTATPAQPDMVTLSATAR